MKNKIILTILSMCLLSSCGKGKETVESSGNVNEDNDTFEVSMLYSDNANYPYKADWLVWDIIEEHTGAKINVQAVPESDYETKRQLAFNTGQAPDIVTKTFPSSEDALSGMLLPISQYEDKMPNYMAWIEKYDMREEIESKRMSDGNYYLLPTSANRSRVQEQQWLVRTDILEKHNLQIPTNLDELYEVGAKLKELYPNSTPITNRFGSGNIMTSFAAGYGTIAGWTIGDGSYYVADTDKWEFAPTTQKWKDMLEYTNKLYESGILDAEFATLDSTIYEQRIVQGQTFIMFDWVPNIERYNLQGRESNPDYNVTPIYPLEGQNGNHAVSWKASWEQAWVFPSDLANRDNFEQILSFIDWGYTDEAEILLSYGIEGETYEVVDGIVKYIDQGNIDYNAITGLNNNCLQIRKHPDIVYSKLNNEQIKLFEQIAEDGVVPMPNPESPLSPEEVEEVKIYTTSLVDYVNTMMEKFIYGQESFDNWETFIQTCEQMGSIDLENKYNEAWMR